MKKSILLFILSFVGLVSYSQYFQATMKIDLTSSGPEAVFYIKATGGNITDGWTGVEFFITYPPADALTFGTPVTNTVDFPLLSIVSYGQNVWGIPISGNYSNWFAFSGTATPTNTYVGGIEYEVFRVPITSSAVDFGNVSMEYDGISPLSTTKLVLTGSVGTGYTAVDQVVNVPVYYGSGTYTGDNGSVIALPSGGSCMYTINDQPLVPMVLFDNAAWAGGTGAGNSPGNGDGSTVCYIKGIGAQVIDANANVLDLTIMAGGTLDILPNAGIEAAGPTMITDHGSLVVLADPSGVGSFIDNGNITYGTNGSASVQTHITNGAAVNTFYMHLMGPTLDEQNYTGPGTGADLQAFNVAPGNTYVYSFDEPTGLWVNQYAYTYPVKTTDGIGLSTDDATPYTMTMTGALMTGNIPTPLPLTFGGSKYELISNPYPSAFHFDAFYYSGTNSNVILGKNWKWNPVTGNWVPYVASTAGAGMIQVGQAFFVETYAQGPVTFYDNTRTHSNVPFRNTKTNWLTLDITGGDYGFADQLSIRFEEGATTGYDEQIEAIKWNSMYANSTQIRSIAEDNTELSINVMPELNLQGENVSIPVNFECGYDGEYTFTASDIESFEYGAEIWIEDKQNGNQWYNLSIANNIYTFTGSPDDPNDRFILHFFGPTSINDTEATGLKIYSDNEYALIRNLTKNEAVKEIIIYSLAGTKILHKQVPSQNQYRFYVSDIDGYYIVRVVTDKNIYTEKVFIH